MDSATMTPRAEPRSLLESFGIASLVVLLGVGVSWVALKNSASENIAELPPLPKFAWAQSAIATGVADIPLIEKAESAFAAGRIAQPEGNSAFHFYRLAVAESPTDEAAVTGLQRTITYMLGSAESAVFRNEWGTAENLARQILAVQPDSASARGLLTRTLRFQKVEQLTSQAAGYLTSGALDQPLGENAVSTYRRILRLDETNVAATQGLNSIAQRFLASAQTSAFAGDLDSANAFIARAEAVQPEYAGLAKTRKMVSDWNAVNKNQALQSKLIAAAEALQEDRLIQPKGNNALALYNEVLAADPKSEAAARGRELVADALVDRAWTLLRAGDPDAANDLSGDAQAAGASNERLAELRQELEYQKTLAKAREGEFESIAAISTLEAIKRVSPDYPRKAAKGDLEGWVELLFTVSVEGDVVEAKVSQSSDAVFERSALAAIKRWRFEPMTRDGRPVPVRSGVRFAFKP